MPETNEWLFDVLWELSDRSHEAGLPNLARKLEEAMDTYLAELKRPALQLRKAAKPGRVTKYKFGSSGWDDPAFKGIRSVSG